ncbi:amidohydrolase family protein [Rouxiella sp. WC2420]|uniref:Amidohydrolase family protein n=1 Tax=Rouxiella sp. WC2420 TaxID=3234145 RepID=A0AB39VXM3_9GAMM
MSYCSGLDRRTLLKLGAALGAGIAMNARAGNSSDLLPGKTSTALLIRHANVITMDPKLGNISDGDVLLRDGTIVSIGKNIAAEGATVLDGAGMILIPGLVDAHWHMWNSFLRNSSPSPQGDTFFKSQLKTSAHFTPALSALGVRLGLAEAADAGITTVNNWAHNIRNPAFADAELQALQSSGLRARFWYGYPQELAATAPMDFKDIERVQQQLMAAGPRRVSLGLAIRGPERTGPKIWQQEFAFVKQHNLPISTHIAVTQEMQKKKAIQQLVDKDLLNPSVQLVHATHADEKDILSIKKSGASVCFTPLSEMRVGYGLAPVAAMHQAKIPLSLGIDTLVLSGNANPFMVMQTALNLATGSSGNELALTARDVLYWATQGGANAMGLGEQIGSITVGKRADVVLIDARRLGLLPMIDPVAAVVQSVTPADIDTVIADGRIIKKGGKLQDIDVPMLAKEAAQGARAVLG